MTKRFTQLAALLAVWFAVVAPATADSQETPAPESETRSAQEQASGREDEKLPPPNDDGDGTGDAWPWVRTLLALAVVVALVLLARWLFRSAEARGIALAGRKHGPLRVVARAALAGRYQLFLVRLGERLVLVGASPQQLTTLSEVTDPAECDRLLAALGRDDAEIRDKQPRTNEAANGNRQEDKR